ncbi:MAG: WHG domain-containing protein [Spirochaetes bacterium]|nr:MAG: WHG domain-containing protein [Spirochaetota bacterium]
MPPKTTFDAASVIDAAFTVLRSEGFDNLSARTIADKLGSSTTPVYSAIGSMKKLEEALLARANGMLYEFQTTPRTGHVFLDMGVGYALFAKEEPMLFRALFLDESPHRALRSRLRKEHFGRLEAQMAGEAMLAGLSEEGRHRVLEHMWVYTHGLSLLASQKALDDDSIEYITDFLKVTGYDIAMAEINRERGAQ